MGFKPSSTSSPSTPTAVLLEKQDKWKLASQLQKSIRHGHVDLARSTALALASLDSAYLRYRMCVMSVEDVGASNAFMIIDDMQPGWNAKAVAARGGNEFLADVAARWAGTVKDRLPCDFLACRHWLAEFEKLHGSWELLAVDRAIELAADASGKWWERGLGAWSAAGTVRFPGGDLPEKEGHWDQWVGFASDFASQECADLMRIGQGQREAHPVFLPLAMDPRRHKIAISGNIPALPANGPWLSAALDKHTAEGKRAMRLLAAGVASSSPELAAVGQDTLVDLVGRVCFWLEGGVCDRFMDDPLRVVVNNESRARLLRNTGVNGAQLRQAMSDPLQWHAARQQALSTRDRALAPLPGLPEALPSTRPRMS